MTETWKDVKGYEGIYQVSDLGNVMSMNYRYTGKKAILKPGIQPVGYPVVVLCKDRIQTTKYIHRLVAEAFLENPQGKPEVNHKDGNKANNRVDNLEWVTCSENITHAYRTGLNDASRVWKKSVEKSRIPVAKLDIDGNVIRTYPSLAQAGKDNRLGHSTIASCARGDRETAGGYRWKFIGKDECEYGTV